MENLTLTKLALISQRARREPKCQHEPGSFAGLKGFSKKATVDSAGTELVAKIVYVCIVVRSVSFTEEPCAGNPHARFCEEH